MSYPYNHTYSYAQYPQTNPGDAPQSLNAANANVPVAIGINQQYYNALTQVIPSIQFQPQIPSIVPGSSTGPENYNPDDPNLIYQQQHPYNYNQQRIPPIAQEASPAILFPPNIQIPIEHQSQSHQPQLQPQPQPHQHQQYQYNSHLVNYPPSYNYAPYGNQFLAAYPPIPYQAPFQRHYLPKAGSDASLSPNVETYTPLPKTFPKYVDSQGQNLLPSESKASHFKPIRTKKNSRPRIHKLNKNEQAVKKLNLEKKKPSLVGELAIDELFQHFLEALKIERPTGKHAKEQPYGVSYQLKLKTDLECQLFDLFVNNVSKCIDVYIPQEVFGKIIPELALYDETNMLLDSIFCLSSLIYQRMNPDSIDPSVPVKYYHQSIKSIRYYLSIPGIENNDRGIISRCLLSTILLCVYELFFVAIDSTYVKGASSILSSILSKQEAGNESLLKNSPFHQTCFSAIFYCDLILSLKFSLPSMYSIVKFWKPLDPEYCESYDSYNDHILTDTTRDRDDILSNLVASRENSVWWLHKSIINFSMINEFNNQVDVLTKEDFENNQPFYNWLELKTLIDEFDMRLPVSFKPLIYKPTSQARVFPLVYFKDEVTAITSLNFKMSKIALYEALVLKTNTSYAMAKPELVKYSRAYAKKLSKDIIGIMKTYEGNQFIWPVNVHAIRLVAPYVLDDPAAFKEFEDLVKRIMVFTCKLDLKQEMFSIIEARKNANEQ